MYATRRFLSTGARRRSVFDWESATASTSIMCSNSGGSNVLDWDCRRVGLI